MDRYIFCIAFCLLIIGAVLLPTDLHGVEIQRQGFAYKNFAGGRFGAWTGMGETRAYDDNLGDSLAFSRSSLYAEFFYAYRIKPPLALEFSMGIFSRGDFKYYSTDNILLGTVNIYPILLSAKFYPLTSVQNLPFFFYLQAGGGIIYGKQVATDYNYGIMFTNDSETKLTYILGGGVDWPVADQIGLCVNYKYIPAKFGKMLSGVRDYSGWQISFGVGYIFGSKGN